MHDVLIAFTFVVFVLGPASLASFAVGGMDPVADEPARLTR